MGTSDYQAKRGWFTSFWLYGMWKAIGRTRRNKCSNKNMDWPPGHAGRLPAVICVHGSTARVSQFQVYGVRKRTDTLPYWIHVSPQGRSMDKPACFRILDEPYLSPNHPALLLPPLTQCFSPASGCWHIVSFTQRAPLSSTTPSHQEKL
ncbi:hypothetical protein BDZ89DRAFT_1147231 [Hymenopellis radicata]|nr:hypothetical protein BDZ89DRAFT_1147231 [Hymenopellis radicata]